jgi:hypothetical protein
MCGGLDIEDRFCSKSAQLKSDCPPGMAHVQHGARPCLSPTSDECGLRSLFCTLLSSLLLFLLFAFPFLRPFFKRYNAFGAGSAKTFEVQLLDELRQRKFPGFLAVIGQFAELLRVQPQFPRHLDLAMREAVTLPSLDPKPKIFHDASILQNER